MYLTYRSPSVPYHYTRESGMNGYADYGYGQGDERFFGFGLLPFVAGLAAGPLLFNSFNNRPCCPPPYQQFQPYAPYPPYPPYPMPYPQYQAPIQAQMFQQQSATPIYGGLNENINIYTK